MEQLFKCLLIYLCWDANEMTAPGLVKVIKKENKKPHSELLLEDEFLL